MSIKIYVKYVKNNRDFHTTKLNLPTGALDSQTGHMIMDIFHKLHEEQGKTVVLITHSKELAAETERIVTLNDGMIVSDSRKTEKGCDLSGYHKMNDGCNKPEIGEGGTLC